MNLVSKAQRTRKFIIGKVAPVFNKKGYWGTALSDIEKATGLTKGAIYGNFRNKDELALACFEHNLKPLQKGLVKALATPGSAGHKLKALLSFYREHYEEVASNGGCPLMNTTIEADDTLPLFKRKVQENVKAWKKELVALITAGQQSGEFNKSVDPSHFATTLMATIEGGIWMAKLMDDRHPLDLILNDLEKKIDIELIISA